MATLSIRPLTVSPNRAAEFIKAVYDSHDHGSSFVPRWTGDFLKYLIFDNPDFTPDHALGAYLDTELVGLILAQPLSIRTKAGVIEGAFGSWLAVTLQGAKHFAAVSLITELRNRLRARDKQFIVGIAYRSGAGSGLDFWQAFSKACPEDVCIGPKLKFWARVLDGKQLAQSSKSALIRFGAHLARIRPVWQSEAATNVRLFDNSDFPDCLKMFHELSATIVSVPKKWDLRCFADLNSGPQTIVFDAGSGPEAIAVCHILPMEDARPLRILMIDHFIQKSGTKGGKQLLEEVLWQGKQCGACLALLPMAPDLSITRLILSGFIPYMEDFRMIYMPLGLQAPAKMTDSFDLPVR